jgi:NADH-quinone oxidoreductase subunit J
LSVTTRQIFRAAIYLLFALVGIAGLYFWLQYQFIAAVQIVVYVGGIVGTDHFFHFPYPAGRRKISAAKDGSKSLFHTGRVCGFALTMLQVYQHEFPATSTGENQATVINIGKKMLSTDEGGYALPFEVISMLLLAAMVGCIVIALRQKIEPNIITEENSREGGETGKGSGKNYKKTYRTLPSFPSSRILKKCNQD